MSDVEDPIDHASDIAERLRSAAEQAIRREAGPEIHPDFDGVHCVDCNGDMPIERLAAKRVRCVTCQGIGEMIAKQFAKQFHRA
jgi:RNA polymerase-binding transcription factor DksA